MTIKIKKVTSRRKTIFFQTHDEEIINFLANKKKKKNIASNEACILIHLRVKRYLLPFVSKFVIQAIASSRRFTNLRLPIVRMLSAAQI